MISLLNNKRKRFVLGAGNDAKEVFWILDYFLQDLVNLRFGGGRNNLDTETYCLGKKVYSIYNVPKVIREDIVLVLTSTVQYKEIEIQARVHFYKYIRRYKDFMELLN